MKTHDPASPGEEPERHKLAPRAAGRHAAVTQTRRAAPETPGAHHVTENRPHDEGVPWFHAITRLVVRIAESLRDAGAEVSDRNLAVTLKVDDRVFSFSASERGETQR
jgi:hypothetical protein